MCLYNRLKSMVGLLPIFNLLTEQVDLSTTTIFEFVKMNYPSCVARKSVLSPNSKVILFGFLYLNHVY